MATRYPPIGILCWTSLKRQKETRQRKKGARKTIYLWTRSQLMMQSRSKSRWNSRINIPRNLARKSSTFGCSFSSRASLVFFAASNRSAVEAAEHTRRHRHRRFTRDKGTNSVLSSLERTEEWKRKTKTPSFKLSLQKTAKKRKRNPLSFKLSLSLQKTTRKRKRKPLSFKLFKEWKKERKKETGKKKQFLSNSLFKGKQETEKRNHSPSKLSLQRKQEKEENNTFFQTLYSKSSSKRRGKTTSFQSRFTHLFFQRGGKTKNNPVFGRVSNCVNNPWFRCLYSFRRR